MFKIKIITALLNLNIKTLFVFLNIAWVTTFIEKYIFADAEYLIWLTIAMILDFVTGVTKVWVTEGSKFITSKGFRDTVAKIIQYGAFLIITHVITHFEVDGAINISFSWLNKIAYQFLILIECKSVYENIVKINPNLDFINHIISKIKSNIKFVDKNQKDGKN